MIMTNANQTSRDSILDTVEFIANQIAVASHLQELINSNTTDIGAIGDDNEEIAILVASNIELGLLLDKSIELRRNCMSYLHNGYDGDNDVRCILKHSIGSWGFATEMLYANFGTDEVGEWANIQQDATEFMYKIISKFLGVDVVKCGRCLTDTLKDKQLKNL